MSCVSSHVPCILTCTVYPHVHYVPSHILYALSCTVCRHMYCVSSALKVFLGLCLLTLRSSVILKRDLYLGPIFKENKTKKERQSLTVAQVGLKLTELLLLPSQCFVGSFLSFLFPPSLSPFLYLGVFTCIYLCIPRAGARGRQKRRWIIESFHGNSGNRTQDLWKWSVLLISPLPLLPTPSACAPRCHPLPATTFYILYTKTTGRSAE